MLLLLTLYLSLSLASAYMISSIRVPLARFGALKAAASPVRAMNICKHFLRMSSTDTPAEPAPASSPAPAPAKVSELSLMEIRVGKIVEIGKHPEADSLYVEKVDLGEPTGPRTIVSGLVAFCSIDNLLNRKVTVLCNLKPRALKGVTSSGMLLCASNADHTQVVPLYPPESAQIGELVTFAGHPPSPAEAGNKASKAYSKIADDFFVDDNSVATFKGTPFMTSGGPIQCSLKGKIS